MEYVREVLARYGVETLLGHAEAVLSSPDADDEERRVAAQALRDLRLLIFGEASRKGHGARNESFQRLGLWIW